MRVISTIPFTRGVWNTHHNREWEGFYFMETVLDWSLYKGCRGKLYVESMDTIISESDGKPEVREGGWLRLAYQYEPANFIPVEGSEIKTKRTFGARWTLQESEWFNLPETGGVACLWIQGRAEESRNISVALATLVIAEQ